MELYGIAGALFAYIFSLFVSSSLAAWAVVAGWNVIWFLLYLAADLLLLTYDKSARAGHHLTVVYFTMGIISPVVPLIRAALVSLNVFSLLCDGLGNRTANPYTVMTQYGGPILYLCIWSITCFLVLVYVDSGRPTPAFLARRNGRVLDWESRLEGHLSPDVKYERKKVATSHAELRVEDLFKAYGKRNIAVRGVSFNVAAGETFALIGPNGGSWWRIRDLPWLGFSDTAHLHSRKDDDIVVHPRSPATHSR
jgi:ABC-type multidrug transport system fused ATPase/permease subunit